MLVPCRYRLLLAAALAASFVTAAPGQMDWKVVSQSRYPPMRYFHAMAHDTARGKTVLFGGAGPGILGDTWEWDGARWIQLQPKTSPSPRYYHAMNYDAARGRVVLFGGQDSQSNLSDTWKWDGNNWTRRSPATNPPPRFQTAMAYDASRQRIVLFGGGYQYYGNNRNDTWEWDGNNWTLRTPATSPPACYAHAMAYDSGRKRTVLFGGSAQVTVGTWEWDGNNWTKQSPVTSPPWRYRHMLTYDAAMGRVVVFGGDGASGQLGDTWVWDGTNWTQKNPATSPVPVMGGAMTYDAARKRAVLFGGRGGPNAHQHYNSTWEWDGARWTNVSAPTGHPSQRYEYSMAFDAARRRIVLFGGGIGGQMLSDTWEWDGKTWIRRNPATSPPGRYAHAMAYDANRRRIVLFGGMGTGSLGDTWEWDGTNWLQQNPAASPPAREFHALVYDSTSRRVLLFGGSTGAGSFPTLFGDTWEWDGKAWNQRTPLTSPPARKAHAMAHDAVRREIVLHGGHTGGFLYLGDTWTWNGTNWRQLTTTTTPANRSSHVMVWDRARQRVVLFGGVIAASNFPRVYWTYYNDTWEWTGTTWTRRSPSTAPPSCTLHQPMAYDETHGCAIQLYSIDFTTWAYAPTDLTASSHTVSLAAAGNVGLTLDPGRMHAGKNYWIVGCVDGTGSRGINVSPMVYLLLYPDSYFGLTVSHPNLFIANALGTLDVNGKATATIRIPAGFPSSLSGTRLYHAYVVFRAKIDFASTPVPLTLTP